MADAAKDTPPPLVPENSHTHSAPPILDEEPRPPPKGGFNSRMGSWYVFVFSVEDKEEQEECRGCV